MVAESNLKWKLMAENQSRECQYENKKEIWMVGPHFEQANGCS